MIGKIQVYIYQNARRLTSAAWFGNLMVQFLKQPNNQLGEAMLKAYINAHELTLKDVERLAKENRELKAAGPQTAIATTAVAAPQQQPTESKIPDGPASTRRDAAPAEQEETDNTDQSPAVREGQRCKAFLNQLLSASEEGVLVMANEDGWGTHLYENSHLSRSYTPRGSVKNQDRNREFVFKRGEILCVSREYRESIVGSSQMNVVVVNARGYHGDVQRARLNQLSNLTVVNYSQQLRGQSDDSEEGWNRKRKRDSSAMEDSFEAGNRVVKAEKTAAVDTWRSYRPA